MPAPRRATPAKAGQAPTLVGKLGDSTQMPSTDLIYCRNITVSRGETRALDGLNLSIPAGEHVALIGPNGSGKSTLIRTIARELHPRYNPDSELTILGKSNWNIFELRPLLGIVSDDLLRRSLRPAVGRDVILSGFFSTLELWPHNIVTPEMERKTDEVIELLEIEHLTARCVSEMSSGESRRILMGRALVHDPQAVILDEPTNSLDMRSAHELRQVFRKIAQSGVGIIMVTHHLPDIIPEIDRIILMKKGKVFGDGAKTDILSNGSLSTLFDMPVELIERDGYYHLI